jgi:GntR family transcriptional regulator
MTYLDRDSSIPFYVQIQDSLYQRIRSGELGPGDRVPSELELVAIYNVSRMTARKALDELVQRGLLFRQRGKGTFVAEHVVTYGLSTNQSFSRTLAAMGFEVRTRVLHQAVSPAPPEVSERLSLRPDSRVVLIRRLRYLNDVPAALHTSFLDYGLYAPILDLDLSGQSLLEAVERTGGLSVAYTRDSVQSALVGPEDRHLLEMPAGSPVLDVEGVAYTDNGQPMRFTRAIYRGDMFRLEVMNAGDRTTRLKVNELRTEPEPLPKKAVRPKRR